MKDNKAFNEFRWFTITVTENVNCGTIVQNDSKWSNWKCKNIYEKKTCNGDYYLNFTEIKKPFPKNGSVTTICNNIQYLCYCPLVYKWPYDGLHVFVQLSQHIRLSEVHWRPVILIQTVGYGIMAPYKPIKTMTQWLWTLLALK